MVKVLKVRFATILLPPHTFPLALHCTAYVLVAGGCVLARVSGGRM